MLLVARMTISNINWVWALNARPCSLGHKPLRLKRFALPYSTNTCWVFGLCRFWFAFLWKLLASFLLQAPVSVQCLSHAPPSPFLCARRWWRRAVPRHVHRKLCFLVLDLRSASAHTLVLCEVLQGKGVVGNDAIPGVTSISTSAVSVRAQVACRCGAPVHLGTCACPLVRFPRARRRPQARMPKPLPVVVPGSVVRPSALWRATPCAHVTVCLR